MNLYNQVSSIHNSRLMATALSVPQQGDPVVRGVQCRLQDTARDSCNRGGLLEVAKANSISMSPCSRSEKL
jgi:catabolite regulation protein CreA